MCILLTINIYILRQSDGFCHLDSVFNVMRINLIIDCCHTFYNFVFYDSLRSFYPEPSLNHGSTGSTHRTYFPGHIPHLPWIPDGRLFPQPNWTPLNKPSHKYHPRTSYSPSDYPDLTSSIGAVDSRSFYGTPSGAAGLQSVLGGTDFFSGTSPFVHSDDQTEYSPDSKPVIKRGGCPSDGAAAAAASPDDAPQDSSPISAGASYYSPFNGTSVGATGFHSALLPSSLHHHHMGAPGAEQRGVQQGGRQGEQ